uniref:Uncharacterized protein n=1 Tax=Caenorhabditis japonica TaxID=281687 RepID=A0A8R1E440_CAEJA
MAQPSHLSQDTVIDKSVGPIKVRVKKFEKERATMAFTDVLPRAELNIPPETHLVKRLADSDSAKLQNLTISKQPQGNSASPSGELVNPSFSDKSEVAAPVSGKSRRIPVVHTEESTLEKKLEDTPARVVAARSQSCGKASAFPQEDIIVASQSNVAPERNAQHLSINVIVKSDSQQAAAAANKRGTTRSSSPNRRITRAMSASQQPRVNVFAMKCAATIQIFPEPARKISTHLCATSKITFRPRQEVLDSNPDASLNEIIDSLRAQYENQYESSSSPGNQMAHPEEQNKCPAHDDQSTSTLLPSRTSSTASSEAPADDRRKPLCDSPAPLLEASAVTPANTVSTERSHNPPPVSIPIIETGHPSATFSSLYPASSEAIDNRQQPDNEPDNDYDIEIDVSDPEECSPPPPEDSMQEVSDPLEPDFAAPIIIQGVQVPAKQKRHPFDDLARSSERSKPIEEPNIPELTPVEADPKQVVAIPVTRLQSSSTTHISDFLPFCHSFTKQSQPTADRFYDSSTSFHNPSGKSHQVALTTLKNFGCSRSSDRLGSLKDIIDERFVRSQEGALDEHNFGTSHGSTLTEQTISSHIVAYSRDICHSFTSDSPDILDVPQNFANTGDTPSPGKFHRATILTRKLNSFTAAQHQSRRN